MGGNATPKGCVPSGKSRHALGWGLPANVRFIGMDHAAHHVGQRGHGHRVTHAHAGEPKGLVVLRAELALKLKGANALLAGAHAGDDVEPRGDRQLGRGKDRVHRHGELLPALLALLQARADLLRGVRGKVADASLIAVPAVGAHRSFGPQHALQELAGFIFGQVLEILYAHGFGVDGSKLKRGL